MMKTSYGFYENARRLANRLILAVGAFLLLGALGPFQDAAPAQTRPQAPKTPTGKTSANPKPTATPNAAAARNSANSAPNSASRSTAKRAGGPRNAPKQERAPENPVRFVFAPKEGAGSASSPEGDPSAAAIWSTLLTGNISPEIVRWHIRQRQKNEAQAQRTSIAQREKLPNGENAVPAADALAGARRTARSADPAWERYQREREAKRSNYEKMLRRMEFSLAPKSSRPDDWDGESLPTDPSGAAILARFLTGRENEEIAAWKKEQALYLAARDTEYNAPSTLPYFPPIPPEYRPHTPPSGELGNERALVADARPPIPAERPSSIPARLPLRTPSPETVPAAYAEVAKAEKPNTERPMIDDQFPTASPVRAASLNRPNAERSAIRPASAQTALAQTPSSQTASAQDASDQAALAEQNRRMKVYRPRESFSEKEPIPVVRPLPENDSDGWSPLP